MVFSTGQGKMSQQVPTQHSSFVHDLAFDFYGSRLATCAGDNEIKIREERNDGWKEIGHCLVLSHIFIPA